MQNIRRREFIAKGSAAIAGLAAFYATHGANAFPGQSGEEIVRWLDQPAPNPVPEVIKNQLVWEDLDSWITPNEKFFSIAHFNRPVIDASTWNLEISGLVKNPMTLTLADLKARPREDVVFTIECSGNHGLPFFDGGVGNARWAGTPLAPILENAGILDSGIEVVFWCADEGEITRPDDVKFVQNFARSMSVTEAMDPRNILCYEMNGVPLPPDNGFPLRLIAPGWYGIANVKWLKRIDVRDRRLENRFMGRDYVTLREEVYDGETVWVETSVGRARLASAPARVSHIGSDYRIVGAAWGAPIDRVEVKIDDGPWMLATIDPSEEAEFAWKIWSLDWPDPPAGVHAVSSRAIDTSCNVQPAMDDPSIATKHTYWESNGQVTRRVQIS
ncbi:MAG: sulfite oxidase [Bauldia sp.]|nr:sulfite oxidase [Bauldia sp.]